MNRTGWKNAKHGQQWENTLKTYVFPVFGDKHVTDISLADVLQVIQSQWTTKNETMNRVRGRIELVLDWAAVRGYRGKENPAVWRGNLDKVLPKPSKVNKSTHHKALDFAGLAPCMNQLLESKSMGAQCLAFAILTAARSGEVRGACWSEINLQSAVWVIPRERMKANREHRVPLSTHAIALLEKLPRFESTDLVFPSLANKALSDMTLTQQLRRMNVAAVPHGFRSTFGDWSREIGGYSEDLREAALAHVVSDKTQAAYVRGDLFEKRRQMMERWGSFCVSEQAPTSQKIHRAS